MQRDATQSRPQQQRQQQRSIQRKKKGQKLGFWIIRVLGCVLKMLKTVANMNLETGKLGI
jgi:hypothetical protein